MDTRFDLRDFAERERGREWAKTLPALFPFVEAEEPPGRPVSGSMFGAAFGAARLWSMTTPALRLRSAPRGGARDNLFSVILPRDGRIDIRQEDRRCRVQPGGFALIDGNRDFEIRSDTATRHLLLQIPRPMVEQRFPHLLAHGGKAFSTAGGGGELLRGLVFQVSRVIASLTEVEQAASLSSILSLLAANARPSPSDAHVEAALAEIERRFCDPDLSAQAVAAAQGVSRRRLDQLFVRSVGRPVTAQIWRRRLEEAAALLSAGDDRSITQLSFALGFEDSAHFARSFRRRHGVSPRAWRAERR